MRKASAGVWMIFGLACYPSSNRQSGQRSVAVAAAAVAAIVEHIHYLLADKERDASCETEEVVRYTDKRTRVGHCHSSSEGHLQVFDIAKRGCAPSTDRDCCSGSNYTAIEDSYFVIFELLA